MDYITRDLQHKTREILDKAMLAPVRIRRGGDFFEITKVKLIVSEKIPNKISETSYIPDNQEYEEPTSPWDKVNRFGQPGPPGDKPSLDDLISSGIIKKGA